MKDLRVVIFRNGVPEAGTRQDFQECYALWRDVWRETFKELEGAEAPPSDNFTRQHEIVSLFLEDRCIGIVCHRFVDLSFLASVEDSYFKPWPHAAIERLCAHGPRVAIGSHITIPRDFRGETPYGKIKGLVTSLSLRRLMEHDVDAIAGTMRADKGMHRLFYECGAVPLEQDVLFHNVKVDLVAFFPKINPFKIDREYAEVVESLYPRNLRKVA